MFVGFPSPTNDSVPPQPDSLSLFLTDNFCVYPITAVFMFAAYGFVHFILQLPLSTFVLYMGYRRWKQQRSSAVMSHIDFYTYNMAAMELIGVLGVIISIFSIFCNIPGMLFVGVLVSGFPWTAQMILPVMICIERYQAVVHPITYMRQRQAARLRNRNISVGLIWLLCFAGLAVMILVIKHPGLSFILACVMVLGLITICFCSLSVLCVLIRPRPGEVGGDRVQADQSKRRAFRSIVIIMGVLLFKFAGNLICYMLNTSVSAHSSIQCVVVSSQVWFNVPCSLVLPLLFLHRTGKLPGCKTSTESG